MPRSRTTANASPAPQRRPSRPGQDHGEASRPEHRHNAPRLAAYGGSRSVGLRNRLVTANLALVHHIARREGARCAVPLEDLLQEGCIGLIRAVEAFDAGRGTALSSVAVPYIRGRMRQHVRDRGCLLRGCRGLRELHHRGMVLQQERLQRGAAPLPENALADALGCTPQRWREALGQVRAQQLRSLDRPARPEESERAGGRDLTPIEALMDPSSDRDPYEQVLAEERQRLLRRRLLALEPQERELLLARVLERRSWRELGRRLGTSAPMARRRFDALVAKLRLELRPQLTP